MRHQRVPKHPRAVYVYHCRIRGKKPMDAGQFRAEMRYLMEKVARMGGMIDGAEYRRCLLTVVDKTL